MWQTNEEFCGFRLWGNFSLAKLHVLNLSNLYWENGAKCTIKDFGGKRRKELVYVSMVFGIVGAVLRQRELSSKVVSTPEFILRTTSILLQYILLVRVRLTVPSETSLKTLLQTCNHKYHHMKNRWYHLRGKSGRQQLRQSRLLDQRLVIQISLQRRRTNRQRPTT